MLEEKKRKICQEPIVGVSESRKAHLDVDSALDETTASYITHRRARETATNSCNVGDVGNLNIDRNTDIASHAEGDSGHRDRKISKRDSTTTAKKSSADGETYVQCGSKRCSAMSPVGNGAARQGEVGSCVGSQGLLSSTRTSAPVPTVPPTPAPAPTVPPISANVTLKTDDKNYHSKAYFPSRASNHDDTCGTGDDDDTVGPTQDDVQTSWANPTTNKSPYQHRSSCHDTANKINSKYAKSIHQDQSSRGHKMRDQPGKYVPLALSTSVAVSAASVHASKCRGMRSHAHSEDRVSNDSEPGVGSSSTCDRQVHLAARDPAGNSKRLSSCLSHDSDDTNDEDIEWLQPSSKKKAVSSDSTVTSSLSSTTHRDRMFACSEAVKSSLSPLSSAIASEQKRKEKRDERNSVQSQLQLADSSSATTHKSERPAMLQPSALPQQQDRFSVESVRRESPDYRVPHDSALLTRKVYRVGYSALSQQSKVWLEACSRAGRLRTSCIRGCGMGWGEIAILEVDTTFEKLLILTSMCVTTLRIDRVLT